MSRFRCTECKDEWEAPSGVVKSTDMSCPSCGGSRIRRASTMAYWRTVAGAAIGDAPQTLAEASGFFSSRVASPDGDLKV